MNASESDNDNNNNNWSNEKELILEKWSVQCDISSWHHTYNSEYYHKLDKWLSIPSIFISAITSTAMLSSLGFDDNKYIIICFGILLIIGTVLQSLRDFLDIHNLIHKNSNCSKLYQFIINDIDSQINLNRNEREDGIKFLNKIKTKKNDILINAPLIQNKNWNTFKESIENGNHMKLRNQQHVLDYIICDTTSDTISDTTSDTHIQINDVVIDATSDEQENTNNMKEIKELDLSIETLKKKLTFF